MIVHEGLNGYDQVAVIPSLCFANSRAKLSSCPERDRWKAKAVICVESNIKPVISSNLFQD